MILQRGGSSVTVKVIKSTGPDARNAKGTGEDEGGGEEKGGVEEREERIVVDRSNRDTIVLQKERKKEAQSEINHFFDMS